MTKLINISQLEELNERSKRANKNGPTDAFLRQLDRTKRYALEPLPRIVGETWRGWTRCQIIWPGDSLVLLDVENDRLEELEDFKEEKGRDGKSAIKRLL